MRKQGQTTRRRHTARDIPRLGPGLHRFDPSLYLRVSPTGARSWVQRIVVCGRQVDRGLGSGALVSLDDARLTALENRRKARAGRDPFAERRRERVTAVTFADAEAATLAANRPRWVDPSIRSWQATMRNHVLPRLGTRRVDTIDRAAVIDCLKAITSTGEARKAKQRIAVVLDLALSREWVRENVAANGGLDAALPHLRRQHTEHHAAAPYANVAGILAQIAAGPCGPAVHACLRFLVLTACRSGEARGAEWAEVDADERTWTIPAARTKSCRAHRVPLSDAALAILAERRALPGRYIFASEVTGRPLSAGSLSRYVRDASVTVHGFRSSFRDWASDVAKAPREVAEAALSHVVGDQTERAYARSDLFERRRSLMADWAAYVTAGALWYEEMMVKIAVSKGMIVLRAGRSGPSSKWSATSLEAQRLLDYHILEAIDTMGSYSLGYPVWDLAYALTPLVNGRILTKEPPRRVYPPDAVL